MSEMPKPCPFCGEKNDIHLVILRDYEGIETGARIECYRCLGYFYQVEATCADDVIAAWNRRAER